MSPICAGLVGLAGIGLLCDSVPRTFRDYSKNFPEIRELRAVEHQREIISLNLCNRESIRPNELLNDNRKLLREYDSLADTIKRLDDRGIELLADPKNKSEK